jgi:thioredoxin reductase
MPGDLQYMPRTAPVPTRPCRCLIRAIFSIPEPQDLLPKGPALANDKVCIRFEGNTLKCRPDTTVAVALWENGVRHLSHSPKYGRPRGVTCARGHCTACLMRVDGIPNVRTCELPVRKGMEIQRQDAGAFYAAPMQMMLSTGHAFFPVGFYYKWFTRPPFVSRIFLGSIRPLTGIGRLPDAKYSLRTLPPAASASGPSNLPAGELGRFDTVVVGAGPAGLTAAARASGRVLLLDDHQDLGGQRFGALKYLAAQPGGVLDRLPALGRALERIESARENISGRDEITFLGRTRAIAGYQPDGLVLRCENHLQTVRFENLIWAAGALDTLGLFPGNDTAGLLGPRALYRLLIRDRLDLAGRQVLVIGGGFDFWLCAALLDAAGARLSLVITASENPAEISVALDRNWQLTTGLKLDRITAKGEAHLRASFIPLAAVNSPMKSHLVMDADLAVVCCRGKPAYDIPYQLGVDMSLQPDRGGFLPNQPSQPLGDREECALPAGHLMVVAGEAAGSLPGAASTPADEVERS